MRTSRPSPRQTTLACGFARPSGFTLLEVLLALGLSAVVMAAVFMGISTYARMTTAGREEVERSRLAQAILRKIERDLRCVVFRPPSLSASSGSSSSAASTGGGAATQSMFGGSSSQQSGSGSSGILTDEASSAVDTQSAYTSSDVGLFGDASTLIVHISRPSRDLSYDPMYNGDQFGGRTSDMQSVSWFLATANGEGLQGAVGNLATGGSARSSRESGVQGLTRLEGDRLAMNLVDAAGETALMAEMAEVVADEVTLLQFRYFDGAAWIDVWDSQTMGALPKAVEITLGFGDVSADADARSTLLIHLGVQQINQVYRLVVAIPLAQ